MPQGDKDEAPGTGAAAADFLIVLVTVPDADTAARIAQAIVGERLAACVNILPGVRSLYRFEEKLCDDAELLCVIKTRRALYDSLQSRVSALHPYQVPEIVAVSVTAGSQPYLAWLLASTDATSR